MGAGAALCQGHIDPPAATAQPFTGCPASAHAERRARWNSGPCQLRLPVALRLRATPGLRCHLCATGQHRALLEDVWSTFDLAPETDLDLMRPGQGLADFSARALTALDRAFAAIGPDLVLVQGDTTSVLCASLAAFYRRVPVGHVEAGLRTGDLQAPWPEEANRVLTARLATLHFAPTARARAHLLDSSMIAGLRRSHEIQ